MFHVCEIGRIGYSFTCAIRIRCGGIDGCGAITIAFCFVSYVFHDCDFLVSHCGRKESANGEIVSSRKKEDYVQMKCADSQDCSLVT